MKKQWFLAGLVAVSGMAFSTAPEPSENEEICVYDDAKSDLCLGMGLTALGVAAIGALLVFGRHLDNSREGVWIGVSGVICSLGGPLMVYEGLQKMRNPQPSLILNKKGFTYQKTFYSWNDVEKMELFKDSVSIFQKIFFKNSTECLEVVISDKLKPIKETIELMEKFYNASQENKQ